MIITTDFESLGFSEVGDPVERGVFQKGDFAAGERGQGGIGVGDETFAKAVDFSLRRGFAFAGGLGGGEAIGRVRLGGPFPAEKAVADRLTLVVFGRHPTVPGGVRGADGAEHPPLGCSGGRVRRISRVDSSVASIRSSKSAQRALKPGERGSVRSDNVRAMSIAPTVREPSDQEKPFLIFSVTRTPKPAVSTEAAI